MSSSYYVDCLAHDPAIRIAELGRDDDMRNACAMGFGDHGRCDTLLMRVSGGLSEVGCPGIKNEQCRGHRDIRWVDVDVLRLMYYTMDDTRPEVQKLFECYTFWCWTKDRLRRLRYEISVVEEE